MQQLLNGRRLILIVTLLMVGPVAASAAVKSRDARKEALTDLGRRVKGVVVWESNRTGNWELYRINTDGTEFKKITDLRRQAGRPTYKHYLRPRVSPDGKTILFGYSTKRRPVEVWMVSTAGGAASRLAVGCPLNWADQGREILFLRDNHVWRYKLASGQVSLVYDIRVPAAGRRGTVVGEVRCDQDLAVFRCDWPAGSYKNLYFDFKRGKTIKTTGGCQPRFTSDGRHMYWVGRSKNFRIWNIASNKEWQLFGKPPVEPFNYSYFPTISADGRWLVYAASPGQHNHGTSDYEIFIQELREWKPVGKPVRLSRHSRTDRWPTLYLTDGTIRRSGMRSAVQSEPAVTCARGDKRQIQR